MSSAGSIIGGHFDVYLRGTSAGTIAGDVRGLQVELTGDESGTRTVSGYLTGIRVRSYLPLSGGVTGTASVLRAEVPESGGVAYDGLLDLTSTHGSGDASVWTDASVTSATAAGVLGIYVNGNKRFINLFSGTPA